jgi:hypothetical protein
MSPAAKLVGKLSAFSLEEGSNFFPSMIGIPGLRSREDESVETEVGVKKMLVKATLGGGGDEERAAELNVRGGVSRENGLEECEGESGLFSVNLEISWSTAWVLLDEDPSYASGGNPGVRSVSISSSRSLAPRCCCCLSIPGPISALISSTFSNPPAKGGIGLMLLVVLPPSVLVEFVRLR